MALTELIARVIPKKHDSPAEVDAIAEIAYLTIAADRRLADEEVEAFRAVVEQLRGVKLPDGALDRVLDEMYGRAERARGREDGSRGYADERLHALAAKLSPPSRELAYRVAYAMGLVDLDASDEEFELDLQLMDALELSSERAEELADEVRDAFQGDPEE
jgi:hypothetical protein